MVNPALHEDSEAMSDACGQFHQPTGVSTFRKSGILFRRHLSFERYVRCIFSESFWLSKKIRKLAAQKLAEHEHELLVLYKLYMFAKVFIII